MAKVLAIMKEVLSLALLCLLTVSEMLRFIEILYVTS